MADLECRVQTAEEGKELTVGDRFLLSCQGSVPEFKLDALELRVDEKDKYKLKLFRAEKKEGGIDLQVTSYVVGQHQIKAAQLVDESSSAVLSDLAFTVASVQDPQQPQQKPFGPFGAVHFFPWLFLILALIVVFSALAPFVVIGFAKRKRRKLMDEVNKQVFQYAAFPELHRLLRQSQRRYLFLSDPRVPGEPKDRENAFQEIDTAFTIYLSREFNVPVRKWPLRRTLRTMTKEHANLPEETIAKIRLALTELEKARGQREKVEVQDLFQLLKIVREVSDQIESHLHRVRGAR